MEIFSVTITDLKSPAQPPLSCLARLGPLSEVKITSVFSMIWIVRKKIKRFLFSVRLQ